MSEERHRLPTLTTSWHYRHGMCGVFDGEVTCGLPRGHSVDVEPHRFHSPSPPFSRWIETDDYGREIRRGGPWEPEPAADVFGAKPTANVVIDPVKPTSTTGTGARRETWTHSDMIHPFQVSVTDDEYVRLPYTAVATMLLGSGWAMAVEPERDPRGPGIHPGSGPKRIDWSLYGDWTEHPDLNRVAYKREPGGSVCLAVAPGASHLSFVLPPGWRPTLTRHMSDGVAWLVVTPDGLCEGRQMTDLTRLFTFPTEGE